MATMGTAAAKAFGLAAGFRLFTAVCFAAMFEMIAPLLTTAAEKLTHLRRFL
jgi:hypothetical protein